MRAIDCPCGHRLEGAANEELFRLAREHVDCDHPACSAPTTSFASVSPRRPRAGGRNGRQRNKVLINLATGMEDGERVLVAFLVATAALQQGQAGQDVLTTKDAVRLGLPGELQGVVCKDARRSSGCSSSSRAAAASCSFARSVSPRAISEARAGPERQGRRCDAALGVGRRRRDRLQLLRGGEMAIEVDIDVDLLKSEIKKTYACVSEEPERDFIFPTGRAWAEDLGYPPSSRTCPTPRSSPLPASPIPGSSAGSSPANVCSTSAPARAPTRSSPRRWSASRAV